MGSGLPPPQVDGSAFAEQGRGQHRGEGRGARCPRTTQVRTQVEGRMRGSSGKEADGSSENKYLRSSSSLERQLHWFTTPMRGGEEKGEMGLSGGVQRGVPHCTDKGTEPQSKQQSQEGSWRTWLVSNTPPASRDTVHPRNDPRRWRGELSSPFYRWRNRGTEQFGKVPRGHPMPVVGPRFDPAV